MKMVELLPSGLKLGAKTVLRWPTQIGNRVSSDWYYTSPYYGPPDSITRKKHKIRMPKPGQKCWVWNDKLELRPSNVGMYVGDGIVFTMEKKVLRYHNTLGAIVAITGAQYKDVKKYAFHRKVLKRLKVI